MELYRRWVEGGLQPLQSEAEVGTLSRFLACVLETGASAPEIAGGNAYELEEPSDTFDASCMASPERQCEMLLALGWDEGLTTVSQLTSHILDRLESQCAYDVAYERMDGAAGGGRPLRAASRRR